MTAPLPPLPSEDEFEQRVFAETGRFIPMDATEVIMRLMHNYAKIAVREALELAAQVCVNEKVDADATGSVEDHAYNVACRHCSETIRAMIEEYK